MHSARRINNAPQAQFMRRQRQISRAGHRFLARIRPRSARSVATYLPPRRRRHRYRAWNDSECVSIIFSAQARNPAPRYARREPLPYGWYVSQLFTGRTISLRETDRPLRVVNNFIVDYPLQPYTFFPRKRGLADRKSPPLRLMMSSIETIGALNFAKNSRNGA